MPKQLHHSDKYAFNYDETYMLTTLNSSNFLGYVCIVMPYKYIQVYKLKEILFTSTCFFRVRTTSK